MTVVGAAAAVFSCLFVLSFGYAQHAPRPHDVRVDVVGRTGVEERVRLALDDAAPGAYDVRPAATETEARTHLQHMTTSGALVERADGDVEVLTAGAGGVPLQQAVERSLGAVAVAQGHHVAVVDVVPLPDDDRAGLSTFALDLGLLVPALVGAMGIFIAGRRTRIWTRVVGALVYAVLAAALAVVMLDPVLGALTGAPWALFGDAVMIAGAFVLAVVALQSLFGLPGTALAVATLVIVGNATNGVAVPTGMLPGGYRQIAPWLPNNAGVHLVRSDVYFDGHGQSGPLLTLAIWLGVAILVVATSDLVHLRMRRATPAPASAIHAGSLVAHLRARHSSEPSGAHRTRSPETPVERPLPSDAVARTQREVAPRRLSRPDARADRSAVAESVQIEIGGTDRTPPIAITVGITTRETT
jgi:hypothetical protein